MQFEIVDTDYAPAVLDDVSAKSEEADEPITEAGRSADVPVIKSQPIEAAVERVPTVDPLPRDTPKAVPANAAPALVTEPRIAEPVVASSDAIPVAVPAVPAPPEVPQLGPGEMASPQVPQFAAPSTLSAAPEQVPQMAAAPIAGPVAPRVDGYNQQAAHAEPSSVELANSPATASLPSQPSARRQLDVQGLSRLLEARAAPRAKARLNSGAIASIIGSAIPRGSSGLRLRERVNLEQMIRSQITPCWNPPVVDEGAGAVSVVMRIRLDRGGGISGFPAISSIKGGDSPYSRALVSSVRRAIMKCSPLRLPSELYNAWSEVELNFDPRDVL